MKPLTALVLFTAVAGCTTLDLAGNARDPFAAPARARVFVFVRSDCPITNRYAPEMRRIAGEFEGEGVEFWLVYADPSETVAKIQRHLADYGFQGLILRDPRHELVKRAHATIAPEAAVFDAAGRLVYHGRIDDLWLDAGRARPQARIHDLDDAIEDLLAGRPVKVSETRAIGCSLADVQ
jgi:hypothetical protein